MSKRVEFFDMQGLSLPVGLPQKGLIRPMGSHPRVFTAYQIDLARPQEAIELLLVKPRMDRKRQAAGVRWFAQCLIKLAVTDKMH